MIVIDWNSLVNYELSLDGDYGYADGFIETLEFESGKTREYLKNSFIPMEYPSLSLLLDNTIPTESGKTEFEEFRRWYEVSLQYGIFSFYLPRLGYKTKPFIIKGEVGIYQFIPNSLTYDRIDGKVNVAFGLREIAYLEEATHKYLATEEGKILLTNQGQLIIALGV